MKGSLSIVIDATHFLGLFSKKEEAWLGGGAEIQMKYLADHFSAHPDLQVVLLGEETSPPLQNKDIGYAKIYPPIQKGVPYLSRLINRSRAMKTLERIQLPAVYLQTHYEDLSLSEYAQKRGIKIVRWINGDSMVDRSQTIDASQRIEIDNRIRKADALIAQNPYQQELLLENYDRSSTVIDSLRPQYTEKLLQEKNAEIIWVGRCHPIKDPESFLALAQLLPQYQFVMIALPKTNDDSYYKEICRRAIHLQNLVLIPGLPSDETKRRIAKASLYVNTSLSEGMPNTLIEASLVKTPTFSLRVNPEGELSFDNGGYCANDSLSDLANTIDFFMKDKKTQIDMGERSYRWALKKWDNAATIDSYVALFEKVTGI